MNTARLRYLALVLVVALLATSTLACDLLGGPTKPTITITAPTSDAQFEEGEEVNVLSSANDAKGITRVELLVDGELYRTDSSPSAEGEKSLAMAQTWTAADPGMHTLSVIAYNVDGAESAAWAVTIKVVEAGGVVATATPTSTSAPPPAATNTPLPPAPTNTPPPPAATETTPPPPEPTPTPPLPDLIVTQITFDPPSPVKDNPVMVGVRIENQGSGEASDFKVVWRSGVGDDGLEWDVASLAPGGASSLYHSYTYAGDGWFTTHAIVDAEGEVDETDNGNNELSWEVQVVSIIVAP